MQEYCVIAFANARVATKGQNILQQTGLKAFLMPTPREITASCGLSLRLSPKDGPRGPGRRWTPPACRMGNGASTI